MTGEDYARGRADGYQAGVLSLRELERAAYQRGAEAMREAAAKSIERVQFPDEWYIAPVAARIRALALPQEARDE